MKMKIKRFAAVLLVFLLSVGVLPCMAETEGIGQPDTEAVWAAYQSAGYQNVHPRLLANSDDFANLCAAYANHADRRSVWIANILAEADDMLPTAPAAYRIQDNLRLLATAQLVLDRVVTLSFSYRITGNVAYADRAKAELMNSINYPDWNPKHFLDTAELSFATAIGYDWLYEYLSAEERAALAEAMVTKGLYEGKKQYEGEGYSGTHFVVQTMNWNAVCNGGLVTAALAVMDEEDYREIALYTVEKAMQSLPYVLNKFAPDGGWDEGPGYWEYTVRYLARMCEAMRYPLGTDFGIAETPGLNQTGNYGYATDGAFGVFNYHDSTATRQDSPVLLWLGKTFNKPELSALCLADMERFDTGGDVWSCLYYNGAAENVDLSAMPKDSYIRGSELVAMRSGTTDYNGLYVAFSGGKNKVNHYHLDEGSFVLDMLGERWADDLGSEDLSYLESDSYTRDGLYRIRAEGHNTLVINPDESGGQLITADCPVTRFESGENGALAVLDMTSAYADNAISVQRGLMVTDGRRTAVIRDEIITESDADIYWGMHTKADIAVSGQSAVLNMNGKSMRVDVLTEGGTAELSVEAAEPMATSPQYEDVQQADNSNYKKLVVHVSGNGTMSISVRITPAEESTARQNFSCDALAEWVLPTAAAAAQATDKMILFNEDFGGNYAEKTGGTPLYISTGGVQLTTMARNMQTTAGVRGSIGGHDEANGALALITANYIGGTEKDGTVKNDPFILIAPQTAQTQTVTTAFDLYCEGGDATPIMQLASGGRYVSLSVSGALSAASGWKRIKIVAHGDTNKADVYLNDALILESVSMNGDYRGIKIINFYPLAASEDEDGYNGILAVDNISMYYGTQWPYLLHHELFDGLSGSKTGATPLAFNCEGVALAAYAQNTKTNACVSGPVGGHDIADKALTLVTAGYIGGAEKDGYIKNDPFISLTANALQSEKVTTEFSLYLEGEAATCLLQLNTGQSRYVDLLSDSKLTLARGVWHTVAVTADCRSGVADVYLNGRRVVENVAMGNSYRGIKIIYMYPKVADENGYNGLLAVDFVRMYYGEREPYCAVYFKNDSETSHADAADAISLHVAKPNYAAYYLPSYAGERLSRLAVLQSCGDVTVTPQEGETCKLLIWHRFMPLKPLDVSR